MLSRLSCPLAETHLAEVSLQFREDAVSSGTSGLWYFLIPVAAIAVALLIYKVASRPPAIVNAPQGMLHELCRVHRISTTGRMLLYRIAEEAELEHPGTMFLGVTQFEAAVAAAGRHIRYDHRQQAMIGILRRRLFAE